MAPNDETMEAEVNYFEMLVLDHRRNACSNSAISNSETEESMIFIPTPCVRYPTSCRTACAECKKEFECPRMFISLFVLCPYCNGIFLVSEIIKASPPNNIPSAAMLSVPMGFQAATEVQPERQDALQPKQNSVHHAHAANNIPFDSTPQILQQERLAGPISTSFQGIQRPQREAQVASLRQEEVPSPNSTAVSSTNMQPIAFESSSSDPSAIPTPEQRTLESSLDLQEYQEPASRQGITMTPPLAQRSPSARRLAPFQYLASTANYTAAEQLNINPYVPAPITSADQVRVQRKVGAVETDAQAANIAQEEATILNNVPAQSQQSETDSEQICDINANPSFFQLTMTEKNAQTSYILNVPRMFTKCMPRSST